jgi:hypothetical protein
MRAILDLAAAGRPVAVRISSGLTGTDAVTVGEAPSRARQQVLAV